MKTYNVFRIESYDGEGGCHYLFLDAYDSKEKAETRADREMIDYRADSLYSQASDTHVQFIVVEKEVK